MKSLINQILYFYSNFKLSLLHQKRKKTQVRIKIDDATIEKNDVSEVIDPLWDIIELSDNPDDYEKSKRKVTSEQFLVLAMMTLMAEVNNGGFDQYFTNSSAVSLRDAQRGFKEINQHEIVKLIDEVIEVYGEFPKLSTYARLEQIERLKPNFDAQDDKFYAIDKDGYLENEIMKYIKENKKSFYFEGFVEKYEETRTSSNKKSNDDWDDPFAEET